VVRANALSWWLFSYGGIRGGTLPETTMVDALSNGRNDNFYGPAGSIERLV